MLGLIKRNFIYMDRNTLNNIHFGLWSLRSFFKGPKWPRTEWTKDRMDQGPKFINHFATRDRSVHCMIVLRDGFQNQVPGSQKISCLYLLGHPEAFDTIDHNILLTINVNLHGSVLEWFKSYLSDRCFRVKCENSFSTSHTCSCGVPQGSVLGPLLFVLYTNHST